MSLQGLRPAVGVWWQLPAKSSTLGYEASELFLAGLDLRLKRWIGWLYTSGWLGGNWLAVGQTLKSPGVAP
jgi:hypothetical protein